VDLFLYSSGIDQCAGYDGFQIAFHYLWDLYLLRSGRWGGSYFSGSDFHDIREYRFSWLWDR
jgi:hypothetical protein